MYALDNAISLRIFYSGNAWFDTVIRKKVSEILFEFRSVVENNGTRSRVPREPVVLQLARHGRTVLVVHGVGFKPAVAGSMKVIAFSLRVSPDFLSMVTVHGPMRSTQTESHGVASGRFAGSFPYFRVFRFAR